jgi:hypothetical protein
MLRLIYGQLQKFLSVKSVTDIKPEWMRFFRENFVWDNPGKSV